MMAPETIILAACNFALVVLGVSFFLTVFRVVRGPTLPDRVLALDMLVGIAIGFIAVIAIRTGYTLYIDIAISLGLVGFLATVAFARFILARGAISELPAPGTTAARPQGDKSAAVEKVSEKAKASVKAKPKTKPRAGPKPGPTARKGGK